MRDCVVRLLAERPMTERELRREVGVRLGRPEPVRVAGALATCLIALFERGAVDRNRQDQLFLLVEPDEAMKR